MTVLCPSCGQENPEDSTSCGDCGAGFAAEHSCPSCGRANPSGLKFCRGCGAGLTDTAPPTRTPTPAPSPTLPASFAGGCYQVKRFLGGGGRKRVHQAQGGKILMSSLLKELTESSGDIEFGEGREVELKGLAGQHRVFEVVW